MSKSIRFPFWIFDGLKHQQRAVQGVSQIGSSNLGASQVGNNLNLANAGSFYADAGACHGQANIYQANQMAKGRSQLENYHGARAGLNRQQFASYENGLNTLVGHRYTLSLKARFGRSCRAFVNAWRGT